ncbi:VOC family protein [bacterium]|nr:VOC family protein [bacterium]MCI0614196.1 VOC family protein [bacterium]
MAKGIPEGYHTVTPYLALHDAKGALEFYKKAFKAEERMRFEHEGKIGHAELQIGDSVVMLSDEYPEMGVKSPKTFGGSPITLYLYVQDVDSFVDHAVKNGARVQRPIENQFYGDRTGTIEDPYGHIWHVSTKVEDLSPEEIQKRAASAPGA